MRSTGWTLALAAVAALFAAGAADAQLPDPPATAEDALRQMFDQAGVVFTGQVVAVRGINAANDAAGGATGRSTGVVEIDFAVDDAILGVTPGSLYTLREWAGLAPAGNLPFQPGQIYLMLLHAPGPSGLSSPVGGPDGAIPIRGSGPAAGPNLPGLGALDPGAANSSNPTAVPARSPAHTTFKAAASVATPAPITPTPDSRTVDLRWIATRVLRPLAYLPDSAATARPNAASADAQPDPASSPAAISTPTQSAAYTGVLALLRSWEQDDRADR